MSSSPRSDDIAPPGHEESGPAPERAGPQSSGEQGDGARRGAVETGEDTDRGPRPREPGRDGEASIMAV